MKSLRFGAHGAGRFDGDHLQATRGKPSRIATGPRANIQNQRRCAWKQVDQPFVDGLGRYRLWLCENGLLHVILAALILTLLRGIG